MIWLLGSRRLISRVFRPIHVLALLTFLTAPATVRAQGPKATDFGWKNMETKGQRPLLVILLQDPIGVKLAHDAKFFDRLFFGYVEPGTLLPGRNSVAPYFEAMSGGRFGWRRASVVGPYAATFTGDNIHSVAISEAAKGGFDFSKFDANRDGIITGNELGVVVIDNSKSNGGQSNPSVSVTLADQKVTVRLPVAGVGPQTGLMTHCHELLHTLGAWEDLYGGTNLNVDLSTMAATIIAGPNGMDERRKLYLDPWHRMQFGWVEPQIRDMRVAGSFELTVPQMGERRSADPPSPLILFNSAQGAKEYFMLEYRNKTAGSKGHYDADVGSKGLAIWHVQQDANKKLIKVPRDADPTTKDVVSLYHRGAPDWIQGGSTLYTQQHGEIKLRWANKRDSGIRVSVNGPADGDKLSVSWRAGLTVIEGAETALLSRRRFAAIALDLGKDARFAARHDMTSESYAAEFQKWRRDGYRLYCMSAYPSGLAGSTVKFAGVWVKDGSNVEWTAFHDQTSEQYQKTFNEMKNFKKMRPWHVTGYMVGDSHRIASIFVNDGVTAWIADHDQQEDRHQQVMSEWQAKGYRTTSATAYPTAAGTRFSLVMAKDSKGVAWEARRNLTAAKYQEEFNKWTGQGYRPSELCGYASKGEVLYSAVFIKSGANVRFSTRHNITEREYQSWINSLEKDRFVPVYVSVCETR